jgi:hypothetical protein
MGQSAIRLRTKLKSGNAGPKAFLCLILLHSGVPALSFLCRPERCARECARESKDPGAACCNHATSGSSTETFTPEAATTLQLPIDKSTLYPEARKAAGRKRRRSETSAGSTYFAPVRKQRENPRTRRFLRARHTNTNGALAALKIASSQNAAPKMPLRMSIHMVEARPKAKFCAGLKDNIAGKKRGQFLMIVLRVAAANLPLHGDVAEATVLE